MRRSKPGAPTRRPRGGHTPRGAGASADPAATGGSRLAVRNWRVATRLNAILLIPVLVALVFGGFRVQSALRTLEEAQEAERTAQLVRAAAAYAHAVIDERDRTAAPLLQGRDDEPAVREVRGVTDAARAEFHARVEQMPDRPGLERRLSVFLKAEPQLARLRETAYSEDAGGVETEEGYVRIQHPLMEFANELGLGTTNVTSYGRTLYSVSLAKAASSLQRSIGTHLLIRPGPGEADRRSQLTAFASYAYLERIAVEEYRGGGTPGDRKLLEAELADAAAENRARVREAVRAAEAGGGPVPSPPAAEEMIGAIASGAPPRTLRERGITAETWYATATGEFNAYREVERELADKAVAETRRIAAEARRDAVVHSAVVLVALLAAFVVAAMMARSMSRGMRRLRTAAFDVAQQRLPSLVDQLSRTDPGRVDTRVRPIPIDSRDEIGEVARAFDQVHREAVRLAAEQALLRGNVNAIFTNLSRRNQGLIEGTLSLITELENNETDPDQLQHLFKLDHLATRMRRNGENLLVLAGEEPGRRWNRPVPLVDVVRAAASEVEQYERIEVFGVPESEIHGAVVNDLVHLLAELLENATSFSSPQTEVRVAATRLPDGRVMIEIHDRGLGLTAEDFADINHRLANPPTVDAAVSRRMGLYVVGRLAARHGIRVQLRPSGERTGTTSLVMLPEAITHGGGGDDREEDFTVSRIVPEQPRAARSAEGGRPLTAAELGFDDSRYGADGASGSTAVDDGGAAPPDPVSRSQRRQERRAVLEARGTALEPLEAESGRHGPPRSPREPLRAEGVPPTRGARNSSHQEVAHRRDHGAPYGSGARTPAHDLRSEAEAESGPSAPFHGGERVGFDQPGRASDGSHAVTDAGLPRREPQRRQAGGGPVPLHQMQPEAPRAPRETLGEAPPRHTANGERWQRAERLRAPRADGVTPSGLPRRVPRANLVEGAAEQAHRDGPQVSRTPEGVRGRLSDLHRGVRRGRSAGGSDATQNDRPGFGPGSTYDQER